MLAFVLYTKPEYLVNWHHAYLCEVLDRFRDFGPGGINNLIVEMPPQHGKSELVSRRLPAMLLGDNPKLKIVGASYSADLAQQFNREVQRIIDTPEYNQAFPETILGRSNVKNDAKGGYLRNADIFETVGYKGFYKSVGVGGSLTGTPADVAIIDDPVKDAVEANSPTYRARIWDWWVNVLLTRLNNSSKKLITMTRWHEDDLVGRVKQIIEKTGEDWYFVSFPAIKENGLNPNDPRQIGEALWPEMHSLEKLERMRIASPKTFGSLFQQDPKPIQTGGEFYKGFDQEANTGTFFYNPKLPIHVTFDFNVLPYITINIHQITGEEGTGFNVRQVDEIAGAPPNNFTAGACRLFAAKYNDHVAGVYIYGDPAGKHQDTRSEQGYNDFDIIYNELKAFAPINRVGTSAAAVALRGAFMNQLFMGMIPGLDFKIDSRCHSTVEDYLYIKETADGTKLKEKMKNESGASFEKYGHRSDANDYFFTECFRSVFSKFKTGDRKLQITTVSRDDSQGSGSRSRF